MRIGGVCEGKKADKYEVRDNRRDSEMQIKIQVETLRASGRVCVTGT